MAFWLRRAPLKRGDVLRTHPRDGYWGWVVVLGVRAATRELHPTCLLGLTPWVFEHEYGFAELEHDRPVFLQEAGHPVLRLYTCKRLVGVTRIGTFDLGGVDHPKVSFEPGEWRPLCGPLDRLVGREAVLAWRKLHDSERLEAEIAAIKTQDRTRREQRLAAAQPRAGTRDHSPRTRLPLAPGELWIGIRIGEGSGAEDAEAATRVVVTLTDRIESAGVGEWLGQSTGRGQVDVSFQLDNRRRARARVAGVLAREFPELDFWISADHEMIFEA